MDRLPDLKILPVPCRRLPSPSRSGRFDHGYKLREEVRQDAALLPSDYMRRFYYDCITHNDEGFERVVGMVGSDRILLGTDFPADMGLPNAVEWLGAQTCLTEADRKAICTTNATRLLNLGPPGRTVRHGQLTQGAPPPAGANPRWTLFFTSSHPVGHPRRRTRCCCSSSWPVSSGGAPRVRCRA